MEDRKRGVDYWSLCGGYLTFMLDQTSSVGAFHKPGA